MAKELQAYLSTGSTLYAILLNSVGQVWSGAAFVAVNGANWGDYDIALTESVAGLYTADMPAVDAGVYSYVVYEQAGASPANTDEWTGNGYLEWDGTAVLPMSTIDTNIDTVDTVADGIQTTLDTPANFMADVSALALEATLSAIKGAGWSDETLKALKDAIDAISVSGASAKEVWEYTTRNLTQSATSIISAVSSSSITQTRGNSWDFDVSELALDSNKQQLAIKYKVADLDAESILFVDSMTGLLVLNGVASTTPTKATLVLVGTTLTLTLDPSISALLPPGDWKFYIQSISATGTVSEPYTGTFTITADGVRATE